MRLHPGHGVTYPSGARSTTAFFCPDPIYFLAICALGSWPPGRRSPRRKHDEILSAMAFIVAPCKKKTRSRQTRLVRTPRYPARLTAFEDLEAVAMEFARRRHELAEHRLPRSSGSIREMGIAFHFRINSQDSVELLALSAGTAHTPARPPPITIIFHIAAGAIASLLRRRPTASTARSSLPGLLLDHDIFILAMGAQWIRVRRLITGLFITCCV